MNNISIFIADDHQLFREGLKSLFKSDKEINIIGEADCGSATIQFVKDNPPDVLLLDIDMPDMNGIETTYYIRRKTNRINILILSNYCSYQHIIEVLKAGAKGFILKNATKEDLINAIKVVSTGNSYFSKEVSEIIASKIVAAKEESLILNNSEDIKLSQREKEILVWIAKGYTNSKIAEKLFLSTHTVITHRRNLLQKINARNTADLVRYASQRGLIT